MTFDPGIPVKTQSPGLFPDQMHADLNRLKTIIEADHIFNNTAQSNDGIHKQVSFLNRVSPVGSPLVNGESGIQWTQPDSMGRPVEFWYNGTQFYPLNALKAMVSFNGVGATIRPGVYNVSSVTRLGVGLYKINFSVPFVPTSNGQDYIVQVTASQTTNIGEMVVGNIADATTGGMTDLFVIIKTTNLSGSARDALNVGVTIYSII